MTASPKQKTPSVPPVQEKIDIEDIKEGVVTLKDGSIRAVLMTSSVNFELKSTEEQDALTYHFQEFLNSLDFPIQILVVSRRFNTAEYLSLLEQKQREQENDLLRIQLSEYVDFVKGLAELANIVTESFYIIIPFAQVETKQLTPVEKISVAVGLKKDTTAAEKQKTFEEMKAQLWQRVNFVLSGLEGFGVRAAPLNDEELMELFYRLYNPEAKEKPPALPSQQSSTLATSG